MKNEEQNIELIIKNIGLKRDKKSFESFFNMFYVELHAIALHVVESDQSAKEAVNEVMLKLWESGKEIMKISDIKAYLYRSVKNQAIDIRRKNKKYIQNIDIAFLKETENPFAENPEDVYLFKEMNTSFNDLIEKMPEKRKAVFYLVKVSGKKYREVAEILNISEKTVEKHMREGFKYLIENNFNFLQNVSKKNHKRVKSLLINFIIPLSQFFHFF